MNSAEQLALDRLRAGLPPLDEVRPAVLRFARAIEAKLRKRDHLTHWRELTDDQAIQKYLEESLELLGEFRCIPEVKPVPHLVAGEAVDAGAMAMVLFDRALGCAPDDPRDRDSAPAPAPAGSDS